LFLIKSKEQPYETARYNPSIATFACHIPNFLTARRNAGAGKISTKQTGNKTMSDMENMSVMLGFMTRK
jgi:hypothetical protein